MKTRDRQLKVLEQCDETNRRRAMELGEVTIPGGPPPTQHTPTPGPWEAQLIFPGNYSIVPTKYAKHASSWTIANVHGQGNDEANARLIAAAPDLLAACAAMINIATHPKATLAGIRMIANEARAAIAKATREIPLEQARKLNNAANADYLNNLVEGDRLQ